MERDNNRDQNASRIPENDPSKAMDSKREVENSNDEKTDQDFPGYPHYPAKEDIMDQRTGSHRVDADLEGLANGPNTSGVNQRYLAGQERKNAGMPESESADRATDRGDLGTDDLSALDSSNDEIGLPQNVSNEELDSDDLPGSDLDQEEDFDSLGRNQD